MKKLQFRPERSLPVHRLPFVRVKKKGVCYWNVPRAGGYSGGCETGRALALVYLRSRKENRQDITFLQYIVLDMFRVEFKSKTTSGYRSLKGQVVGFFSELDRLFLANEKDRNAYLESMDNQKLLANAQRGLKDINQKFSGR